MALILLILSASGHPCDHSQFATLPVADWVTKPLTQEKVQDLLHQYFHQQLPSVG